MKKADLAKPALSAIQIGTQLRASLGDLVQRVAPKTFIATTAYDEAILARLMGDEIDDWNDLASIFGGGKTYADKKKLAEDGTPFIITRAVERIDGDIDGNDDWAIEISVVETGEKQVLSLSKNPERDIMVYVIIAALAKLGHSKPMQLVSIPLAETDTRPAGRSFYTLGVANMSPGYANVSPQYARPQYARAVEPTTYNDGDDVITESWR